MYIGVDIDEVLAEFLPAFLRFYNAKYGTAFEVKNFYTYSFWHVLGADKETAQQDVLAFLHSPDFLALKPVSGAVKTVAKLSLQHKLIVITSRHPEVQPQTITWIDQYFPNVFEDVLFANHFAFGSRLLPTKKEYCESLGLHAMIDDCFEYIQECASQNCMGILMNAPWNQFDLPPHTKRVSSWLEISQFLSKKR